MSKTKTLSSWSLHFWWGVKQTYIASDVLEAESTLEKNKGAKDAE